MDMLTIQKLMHVCFLFTYSFTWIDINYLFQEMQAKTTAMNLSSVRYFFTLAKQLTTLHINPGLLYKVHWPLKKKLNCNLNFFYTLELDS